MSSFTDPLEVRQLPAEDLWETLRDVTYWTECSDGDEPLAARCKTSFRIPAGFKTDFASIPRIVWPIIGHPAGRYAQAAVLHDCLYRMPSLVTRSEADELFREAMAVLGVPAWQRWAMWAAVRVGGSFAFAGSPADQENRNG